MHAIRVLVGTRKGAFILSSDVSRKRWDVSGPHFGGWEIYHLKGSPADPDRLYASQSSDWFGQVIHRSDDGGKSWAPVGNEFAYNGNPGTHQWYDGTQHPWEFTRVWYLEPSLPRSRHGLCRRGGCSPVSYEDGGQTWHELSWFARGQRRAVGARRRGHVFAHHSLQIPPIPGAFSPLSRLPGAFRSDDGGDSWKPITRGLESPTSSQIRTPMSVTASTI
jgi:hypothetical protein